MGCCASKHNHDVVRASMKNGTNGRLSQHHEPTAQHSSHGQRHSVNPDQDSAIRCMFDRVVVNRPPSWTDENALCHWSGVEIDDDGNVTEITAAGTQMEGEVNWECLLHLHKLEVLDLCGHRLSGVFKTTPELRHLPLRLLDLTRIDCAKTEFGAPLTIVLGDHLSPKTSLFL